MAFQLMAAMLGDGIAAKRLLDTMIGKMKEF